MSINTQVLEGNWNEIKGKLRERWGQVSGEDLQRVKGNVEQLVGMIQTKTGEARGQVEKYLSELTAGSAAGVNRAMNAAKDYAGQAAGSVEEAWTGAADMARHGYESTERMVRERPLESLVVGFGAGLVTGVVLGIVLKSK